ncbi:5-methyltetrahydropteroyltriglutamate--homocysteine S-methyltransferase [Goodfellowiella coeruleoviolacea]|uniref:5-methyltetrahydropteroyltriglutamate--homocysteine methyltransferase n=1 Tax=Goodfellowiella coeruleoviolacea TaxID=334858 RepID=A0AAE3GEC3_9PSEU|nr:5-methyltetrahydropteroyltriglutamate--homocysteine S-methyltransferase [Goodfellowiella coeruleoviolacea]MCP2166712.1 methionine synthase (B12-independent) [Goodfellowiella coeruleoviolacea]
MSHNENPFDASPAGHPPIGATVLGYPRIGPRRELKRALERYWAGRSTEDELHATGRRLRERTWLELRDAGLDSVPGNTFSYYDQVLDTAVLFDAVPERFRAAGLSELDTYFAMARGVAGVPPLELTKWFDTNYHHLVPELAEHTRFALVGDKPVAEYRQAAALGVRTRPVLLGPVSFLLLAKPSPAARPGFTPLDLLEPLLACYGELLARLRAAGASWVQLDEPALVADRSPAEIAAVRTAYAWLSGRTERPALLVAGYYGELGEALDPLARTGIEALGVDLVAGRAGLNRLVATPALRDKTLVAGVVDGRNVWRTDLDAALATCATLFGTAGAVAVSTSCPLLHVPYDVTVESTMDARLRSWLAFARQKVDEVVLLGRALRHGPDRVAGELAEVRATRQDRAGAPGLRDDRVRARLAALRPEDARRGPYPRRAAAQRAALRLPALPTTTIGSFPQTDAVRRARAALRAGQLDPAGYRERMRAEITRVVRLQEEIGLDVLVHGEPERNDMVQYFAERLAGFATTELGWVQSYGSRCVRPPILFGDVSRPAPMTVSWAGFAQSLTPRPVKGMLTGPVTILAWSFVRDDQPLATTARQVALAIRDEVRDLEAAGIRVVQVDEPALRELLPPRKRHRRDYLDWAVTAFRLATSGVADSTQIHTHMCYSEFGDVLDAIDGIDADVTSVEAARSGMAVLADLASAGFARQVGPGVYDIHSPRVPDVAEIAELLRAAVRAVPGERLWVNPDCGLKTRSYDQVEPALRNLVAAAGQVRADLAR